MVLQVAGPEPQVTDHLNSYRISRKTLFLLQPSLRSLDKIGPCSLPPSLLYGTIQRQPRPRHNAFLRSSSSVKNRCVTASGHPERSGPSLFFVRPLRNGPRSRGTSLRLSLHFQSPKSPPHWHFSRTRPRIHSAPTVESGFRGFAQPSLHARENDSSHFLAANSHGPRTRRRAELAH